MLKNNIVHTRGLLGYLKDKYNGVFSINNETPTKITGNVEIDYDSSFGTSDNGTTCNYIISNGNLYFNNGGELKQIENITGWTSVCGYGTSPNYAYGIAAGKLYALMGTTATQIGTATSWSMISGSSDNNSVYAYGITGGKLYRLKGTSATQVGSSTKWEFIQNSSQDAFYTYGINSGFVYSIVNTTTKKIGTVSSFKEVRGAVFGGYSPVLARTDSQLYRVIGGDSSTLLLINLIKDWTKISKGYGNNGYAIGNGELYHINLENGKITQIGDSNTWEDLTGVNSQTLHGYALNKGFVYKLLGSTATKIDVQRCKGIYGGNRPIAICEVK